MIIRQAIFEGELKQGCEEIFREEILKNILPLWKKMPGVRHVRISFEDSRDQGSAPYPLMVAISYDSLSDMETALTSPERMDTKEATELLLAKYFKGELHHHVTSSFDFPNS